MALWRAKDKPPIELVVANLDQNLIAKWKTLLEQNGGGIPKCLGYIIAVIKARKE